MNLSIISRRGLLPMALVAALMLLLGAGDASAQLGACRCPNVIVRNQAHCEVFLVLQGSAETQLVVPANSKGSFLCEPGLNVLVQDCQGRLHRLTPGVCVDVVLAEGCCTRVCLEEVARGCYQVNVQPPVVDCHCQ